FVAACEMTPRGSGPTPTEPTMADVLEPVPEGVSVITGVDFGVDTAAAHVTPEGDVLVARIGPDVDMLWTEGQRVQSLSGRIEGNPLFILNGERVESIDGLDPNTIVTVDVIKGQVAIERYGE